MATRTDQDSPWKEILRQYFPEAIAFFFPRLHHLSDWKKPFEFLDKEFQQLAPDAERGKRYADLLVKVWRKRGKPLFLLLHVEVQAKPEASFAERMFVYALRTFDRFRQPAVSSAILCDTKADWRPDRHTRRNAKCPTLPAWKKLALREVFKKDGRKDNKRDNDHCYCCC